MEKVELKHDEELVLRCKNSKNLIVKKRYKSLEGPILVNVNCEIPEIKTPLTFQEAMIAGDLFAIPSAGHMFSGVQTKYLPPTHLPDGTPNPARMRLLRQRSIEREQALANMSKEQLAKYKEKIAKLTGDPRLEHAKNIGLYPAYKLAVKAKEAKQKAEKAKREAEKAMQNAKKVKKASLKKSKSNKSRGGRKKLRKKTKKRRSNRKKLKRRKKKKTRKR
tara:strand:+ start:584 stop:1243 length:660 start_codon:yes stop_codon:yes gene_type:complete